MNPRNQSTSQRPLGHQRKCQLLKETKSPEQSKHGANPQHTTPSGNVAHSPQHLQVFPVFPLAASAAKATNHSLPKLWARQAGATISRMEAFQDTVRRKTRRAKQCFSVSQPTWTNKDLSFSNYQTHEIRHFIISL